MKRHDVFLVTKGVYSNYAVLAVFSTRPQANAFIRRLKVNHHSYVETHRVERYPLDTPPARQFATRITLNDEGMPVDVYVSTADDFNSIPSLRFEWTYHNKRENTTRLLCLIYGDDTALATKTAMDVFEALKKRSVKWGDKNQLAHFARMHPWAGASP